jgi:O-antigen/teichoic acid export membrane protein
VVACSRQFPASSLFIPGYSSAIIKSNLKYTLQMAVISLTALAYLQTDKLLLSKILPIETFGYYYFAYGLVSKGALVTMAFSYAAFPYVSNAHNAGDADVLRAHYHKLQDALCLLTVPVFAAIWFASLPLFTYLFDRQVAQTLSLPTALMCVGFYMTGTLTIPNNVAFAMGRAGIVARQNCLAVVVLLPATYICVRTWGLVGASLSIVIYSLFCYAYSIPKICAECLGMPPARWYQKVLKGYALGFATYGFAYAALRSAHDLRVSSWFVAYLVATAAMLTGTYYCVGNDTQQSIAGLYAYLKPGRAQSRRLSL